MPVYRDSKRKTWYCVYSFTENGEYKQKKKRGFSTKAEAQDWEAEQRKAEQVISRTVLQVLNEMCVSLDSTEYTTNMKQRWLENHFEYLNEPIESLSRQQLTEWRNALKTADLSPRTMNQGIAYIKSLYVYASEIYNTPNNASVLRPYKVKQQEMPVWTPEQFAKFQEACDPEFVPFFTFLYWTGCRRGEAMALCKDDIEGNKAKITKAIRYQKHGFTRLKNKASKRTITIDDKTLALLDLGHAEPFIFGHSKPLTPATIQRRFKKATQDANLPPIRIHDLRHSHATVLINNGANIVAISKRLGHASINQTLKTYSHLLEKSNDEMMEIIMEIR